MYFNLNFKLPKVNSDYIRQTIYFIGYWKTSQPGKKDCGKGLPLLLRYGYQLQLAQEKLSEAIKNHDCLIFIVAPNLCM